MATVCSVVITKSFDYRGAPEEWANRYHFVGGTPPDRTHWGTLLDAIIASEKTCYTSRVSVVRARCYLHDEKPEVAVQNFDYTGITGTLSTSLPWAPGDCATLISWATLERDSRNHTIHCHTFMHDAHMSATGGSDYIPGAQLTALQAHGTAWISPGFSDGATTYQRSTPDGHLCVSQSVTGTIKRRKLKRRG